MSSLALDPKPGHRDTGAPVVSPDPENTQILIVDDDEIITESIHEFMLRSGYRSSMVHSGEAALEFLATSPVDVVITDIMMPGLDGLELTDQIRSLHHHTDVIVMTGYGGDYSYEEAIQKGAQDFVTKPFSAEQLQETMQVIAEDVEEPIGGWPARGRTRHTRRFASLT